MALLRLQTRRNASVRNIRNRTLEISLPQPPDRSHPYRASGLVRWRIEAVTDEGVCIFLPRTGHRRTLGFDHIHQYTSDRIERQVSYGFLTLNVQLSIQGDDVGVTPTRPGKTLPPRIPP